MQHPSLKRWQEEEKKRTQFRLKLEAEHGLLTNPKAPLLFEKVWELGHAAGEHEVAIYYTDLKELIQ
jgi:hypothetical protein